MKLLAKFTLTAAFLLVCTGAFAQKFAVINSAELIEVMPERATAATQFEEYQVELNRQLDAIEAEYNTKFEDYQKNLATLTEAVRQAKERELTGIEQRHAQFQQQMSADLQQMNYTLMGPIYEKAMAAIDEISKASGYTMVFDISQSTLLYHDASSVTDILPAVKEKLGIPANATPAPPTAAR